jgi:predicted PurR-regulated permease PerM
MKDSLPTRPPSRAGQTAGTAPAGPAPARVYSRRRDILFAFAIALALALAWYVRDVLILLYVSALFAVVLTPVVRAIMNLRFRRWSPGRGAAVALILLAICGSIALFIAFALPPVIHDLKELLTEMPTRGPEMLSRLKKIPFARHLDTTAINARLQDYASNFAGYALKSFSGWANKLFSIVMGFILTAYFILEGDKAYDWVLSFLPKEKACRLDATLIRADVRMGKWLLGQATLMLILAVASTIVFVAMHIRYAYALGVLMGAMNLIPIVGALISMALVILAAAIDSWGKVLGVCIFYTVYVNIETSYLTPRIMQSSVDLAGLAVIVALLLGSALDGVVGAMVSVPTAVLVAVLLDEYLIQHDPIRTAEQRAEMIDEQLEQEARAEKTSAS